MEKAKEKNTLQSSQVLEEDVSIQEVPKIPKDESPDLLLFISNCTRSKYQEKEKHLRRGDPVPVLIKHSLFCKCNWR